MNVVVDENRFLDSLLKLIVVSFADSNMHIVSYWDQLRACMVFIFSIVSGNVSELVCELHKRSSRYVDHLNY